MNRPAGTPKGVVKLLACLSVLLVLWLGVLPWIAQLPPVESHLRTLRENHVDAGVMFYSELDPRVFPDGDPMKKVQPKRPSKETTSAVPQQVSGLSE